MESETSSGLDPLDMIKAGTHEADDAMQLADLMITPTSDGEHWDEKARTLLGILIIYVRHNYRDTPELRTLAQVRALAAQDWAGLETTLRDAMTLGPISLREEASSILAMEKSDELCSIKSKMDKATSIWSADKPALR
jgi:type IV secretory pathway TraG/TraD family ATPase VirD4